MTALLRERLQQALDDETGRTFAHLIVEEWLEAAIERNIPAIKEILDRTEGKVPDKVEIDDLRKAYVTESPRTLCLPEPEHDSPPDSVPTNPMALPDEHGETSDPNSF